MNKKNMVSGAALIGISWIIARIIGAVARIVISPNIGAQELAFFQVAYPIYFAILVMSIMAIPSAISRAVSSKMATRDFKAAHFIFKNSLVTFAIIGLVLAVVGWLVAGVSATFIQIDGAKQSLQFISIAWFVCLVSAVFRGYFQGLKLYVISAGSQVLTQVLKFIATFIFATVFSGNQKASIDAGTAASTGLVGSSFALGFVVAETITLAILIFIYFLQKEKIMQRIKLNNNNNNIKYNYKAAVSRIIMNALYSTLGLAGISAVMIVDNLFFVSKTIDFGITETMMAFGAYQLSVLMLVLFPALLVLGLALIVMPAISSARIKKDFTSAQKASGALLKTTIAIILPCALGLFLLAKPIINLLFAGGTLFSVEQVDLAVQMLRIMSLGALFLPLSICCAVILQAMGRSIITVFTFLFALALKIIALLILTGIPSVNVQGIVFSTVIFCITTGLLNAMYVIRLSGIKFEALNFILKPFIAVATMGLVVYFAYEKLLVKLMAENLACIIAILIGALLYCAVIAVLTIFKSDEIEYIPGIAAFANSMTSKNN